jgi:hypothetical protein
LISPDLDIRAGSDTSLFIKIQLLIFTKRRLLPGNSFAPADRKSGSKMKSDFSAACDYLDRALSKLCGDDATSEKAREALELLVEAILVAQHSQPLKEARILQFPSLRRSRMTPETGSAGTPPSSCRGWKSGREADHPSEVLGDRGEQELISGTAEPAQTHPFEAHRGLEVCEQHLDLLALVAGTVEVGVPTSTRA